MLSIIIPAYNVENCISRCLDSILNQDYHISFEIIVVNDGSTDRTQEILESYEKNYPNLFRIISKANGGVPSARNAGMDIAQGEWIWLCDADDYVVANGLSYVIDNFLDEKFDIVTFFSITLDAIALKTFKEPEEIKGKIIFEGTTIGKYQQDPPNFVWNHIYKRSAIGTLRFQDVTMCEDSVFNLEVYMKNLRLRSTDTNIYRYTVSEGQVSKKRDILTMRKSIKSYKHFFELTKAYGAKSTSPILPACLDKMIAIQFTPFISRVLSAKLSTQECKALFDELKEKHIFPIIEIGRFQKVYNFIGEHPYLYPIFSFAYRKAIIPFILPKISRN